MTTNEFERDLDDQAGLKRPGRIDLRVLQNTPDAGDGHPGVQRCFRNYLHEGGIEKDIQLLGFSILGNSVNINNDELQQLSNIGSSVITSSIWSQLNNIEATTISAAQWVFVGQADQDVRQADSPTFVGLTLSADLVTTSTIDSVDVSDLKAAFDTHKASSGVDHTYIDQSVISGASPTFANPIITNLYLADDIIHTGDENNLISFGTDTQDFRTGGSSRLDISDSGVRIGASGQRVTEIENAITNTSTKLVSSAGVYVHSNSTSNPHSVTAQQAFTANKTISVVGPIFTGCNSDANAFLIGEAIDKLKFWHDGTQGHIKNNVGILNFDHPQVISSSDPRIVITDTRTGDNKKILKLVFSGDSSIGASDKWITFYDSGGEVGQIHSEVVYTEFTGAHSSQTKDDISEWEIGMILSSTGKMIGKPTIGRALVKVKLTTKKQDKAVYGVFCDIEKTHDKKGFNKNKPSLCVNALGEGQILVTDTNGNINIGDYIQSSTINGLGEKQDDDILHNYTVAKATQSVNWNRIKAKNGIKKKLIACTYHCG